MPAAAARSPEGSGPTRELRIHGVGGSPGPKMLGYPADSDVVVVGEGRGGSAVLARRSDPAVEGYDWGGLTSNSGSQPLWVLLLPFTLLNVAGWMHPAKHDATFRSQAVVMRWLVHALSGVLTAAYVFNFAVILVDLVGYQWARRVAAQMEASAPLPGGVAWQQRLGVGLGIAALTALAVLLVWVAGRSRSEFEEVGLDPALREDSDIDPAAPWGADEGLDSLGFFWHPRSAGRRLLVHKAILALSVAMVAALAVVRMNHDVRPETLDIGASLLGPTYGLAILLVAALWAASALRPRAAGPAVAATLSFAALNAVFAGTVLLVVKRLSGWPAVAGRGAPELVAGPEASLVDVWGGVVLVLAVAALAMLAVLRVRPRPVTDVPTRTSGPGHPLDGVDDAGRRSLAGARSMARLARRARPIAFGLALGLVVLDFVFVWVRLDTTSWVVESPRNTNQFFYRVGAYVLPFLPLLVVQLVRRSRQRRTILGTVWDVLTFWPRRFSPLAVRAYAERAVPELQGRIAHHVLHEKAPLVVSAHSQGSILAFAALAPLGPTCAPRIGLVTYGCPVTTIYAAFFPAYFGPAAVENLRIKLAEPGGDLVGWRNFFRSTDPIGGPVFGAARPAHDVELADPARPSAAAPAAAGPPLEHDRPAWIDIAGHSHYLREPELKNWVVRLKSALNGNASQPSARSSASVVIGEEARSSDRGVEGRLGPR